MKIFCTDQNKEKKVRREFLDSSCVFFSLLFQKLLQQQRQIERFSTNDCRPI